jgi:RNA polymerase sigma-70 factor (ECF subfamily)
MDGVQNGKLSSWLFKVAINEFRNRMKKQKRVYQLSIDEEDFANRLADEEDFTEDILLKERNSEIKSCLDKLNDGYRELLILKYGLELSYKEIAVLLGMQETVVKTYLYRARKEFESKWRDGYE